MRLITACVFAAALIVQAAKDFASTAPAVIHDMPGFATVPSSMQFDLRSSISGEDYLVRVYVPRGTPPKEGWPSIFVLDGETLFGTFAAAVMNRSNVGEIEPAVVIGISSGDGDRGADRTYDFTSLDLSAREKTLIKDLGPHSRFGGSEQFFRVIQQEIRPKVSTIAPLDQHRTALFGWSLGGLFVIHTMLEHPDAFDVYLALSPSLWRSDREVFREVPGFENQIEAGISRPGLFIGAGSLEDEAPVGLLSNEMSHQDLETELRYCRMVENARSMSMLLKPFFIRNQMPFDSKIFEGETHNSVPWSAVNPILNFALPRTPSKSSS